MEAGAKENVLTHFRSPTNVIFRERNTRIAVQQTIERVLQA